MDTNLIITQGGHTHCLASNWRGHGEWSEVVKLYAPTAGRGWIVLAHKRTILLPGNIYLIPPHRHLEYGTENEFVVDWLHFMPSSPTLDTRLAAWEQVQTFAAGIVAWWKPVAQQLGRFETDATPALTCRVHALLLDLVGLALENMPANDSLDGKGLERLLPAVRLMDNHVINPPPLATLARAVHLSPEHFHRLFVGAFRVTPFEYLQRRRMARAQQLLMEGALSVKEVATACGYDDPYYFSRVFRQRYRCTPRSVRLGQVRPVP